LSGPALPPPPLSGLANSGGTLFAASLKTVKEND